MRRHELRGIFVIGLLSLAVLGVFLFGVVAKAETSANATRFPASPAAQLSVRGAAGTEVNLSLLLVTMHQGIGSHHAGNLVAANLRFKEPKKEKHYA